MIVAASQRLRVQAKFWLSNADNQWDKGDELFIPLFLFSTDFHGMKCCPN